MGYERTKSSPSVDYRLNNRMWRDASVFHLNSGSRCDGLSSVTSALSAPTEFVNLQKIVRVPNPRCQSQLNGAIRFRRPRTYIFGTILPGHDGIKVEAPIHAPGDQSSNSWNHGLLGGGPG